MRPLQRGRHCDTGRVAGITVRVSRFVRRGLGILALAAVLVAAGALLTVGLSWKDRSRIVAHRASAALGLEVGITGGIELQFFPELQFEARDVTVANLPGRPSPHLAEIGMLELEISYLGLLRGQLEIDALELEQVRIWIESDPNAHLGVAAAATTREKEPESRQLRFDIQSLEISELELHYQPGDAETLRSGRLATLSIETDGGGEPLHLASRGEFAGHQFDLTGKFGALAKLSGAGAPFPIELSGELLDANFKIRGTAAQPKQLRGLDLAISGDLPNLAGLYATFREPDERIPKTGPIAFKGRLVRSDGPVAIEDLSIRTGTSEPLRGSVTGSIGDLAGFRKVALEVELEARDLSFLGPLVDRPLPALQSLDAKLQLSDVDGGLELSGRVQLLLPDGLGRIEVEGKHRDLHGLAGLDVAIRGEARDLASLGKWLGLERPLPPLRPITLRAQLRDQERRIGIDALEASAGSRDATWVLVRGSVRDLERVEGVELRAEFGAENLSLFEAYFERPLPNIGPVTGSSTLTDRDGSLGLEPIRLQGGRKELLSVDFEGSIDDLREIDDIEANAKISARDLAVIGELVDADFAPIGPIEFSGTIRGSDEDIRSSGRLQLDRTFLKAHWNGSFAPGARPHFQAVLSSPQVWLDDLGIEPGTTQKSPDPDPGDAAERWWRGSEKIDFDVLRHVDLDLSLRAETISGREAFALHNVGASLQLEDGKLQIRDLSAAWAGGKLHADVVIDASTPGTELSLEFDLENLDLRKIAVQLREQTDSSGLVDARLRLQSEGETLDAIRSQLSGEALAIVRDGTAAGEISKQFIRNVVDVSFPSLRVRRRVALVSCLLAFTEIEAGIVTIQELRIQGGNVEVRGTGNINLVEELYGLDLVPRSRKRGIVSIVPVVRVRGPLDDPKIAPVPRTIATSIFEGVVSNAARPFRALIKPFRRNSESEFRCALPAPEQPQP